MEIAIIGQGEVVIRFIDQHGDTLVQERLFVSGPPGVQALRYVPLSIGTAGGPAEVAPVLVSLSNREQRATFDGEDPVRFARRRCKAIGCSATVARNAARGKVPAPTPHGAGVTSASELSMPSVLRAASNRLRGRR
jgi:hypothetical protein